MGVRKMVHTRPWLLLIFARLFVEAAPDDQFKWGGTDIPSWIKGQPSRQMFRWAPEMEDVITENFGNPVIDLDLSLVMQKISRILLNRKWNRNKFTVRYRKKPELTSTGVS